MNQESRKIKSFTDLLVWQLGHSFVLAIYKNTQDFPGDEKFGLTNQIRRAAVSFTSNIAEGFSRNSYKEKVQFYSIALGSLTEVQNQLLIARDLHFIPRTQFSLLAEKAIELHKMTNALIKKSKTLILNS